MRIAGRDRDLILRLATRKRGGGRRRLRQSLEEDRQQDCQGRSMRSSGPEHLPARPGIQILFLADASQRVANHSLLEIAKPAGRLITLLLNGREEQRVQLGPGRFDLARDVSIIWRGSIHPLHCATGSIPGQRRAFGLRTPSDDRKKMRGPNESGPG